MTVLQFLAGFILELLLVIRLQRWIVGCLPITDRTLAAFERLIMEDNMYVLPCGGGVVYGHYQGLFWSRLLYGSRHTARLCAHYLMRHGFVNTHDPEIFHLVADTPQAYANTIFHETAARGTRRELIRLRRRWAKEEAKTDSPRWVMFSHPWIWANAGISTYSRPSDLARDVCDRLIDWLS